MKTIVFASQKGGSSKSMLCRCQAVAAEMAGDGPVTIIDTDPQGTTAKWFRRRVAETPVLLTVPDIEHELPKALKASREAGFRYTFIDTQGAITSTLAAVCKHADFILIPLNASPDDIDAIPDTLDIIGALGKPFAFILTKVKQQALITGEAKIYMASFGLMCPVVMGDRIDYPRGVTDGRTVMETEPNSRSAGEMLELWDYLKGRLALPKSGRKEHIA